MSVHIHGSIISNCRSLNKFPLLFTAPFYTHTQASALKLEADKQSLESLVADAQTRLEQGLPPTEEMEVEWLRMERQEQTLAQIKDVREELTQLQELARQGQLTTAPVRPNAYIPGESGVPVPFGAFAPLKPSEQGSTMRHIRKPQIREIVI